MINRIVEWSSAGSHRGWLSSQLNAPLRPIHSQRQLFKGYDMDYWDLVDPIWEKVSIYDGSATFLLEFNKAPHAARTLFAAHWCQSEICNGGFDQFFSNSTGVLAPEAIAAFKEINMPQIAGLIESAVALFGPKYPRSGDDRDAALVSISSNFGDGEGPGPFGQFDEPFFALIEKENGGFEVAANAYAAKSS